MNLVVALKRARPGEQWSLNGDDYGGLIWLDKTTPPTLDELTVAWAAFLAERAAVAYRDQRAIAYRDQLGKEAGDYIKTLGDVLDTLIAEMAALAAAANVTTPEFSALLKKIQAVKAEFPKP